jgi:signal transduction histidine kinase/CheY-like chemotaxis protein
MARQRIIPIRREYNRWVANQTLEDYALRFTAKSARQFSSTRISQTAIGAISFLALEAIGGSITLSYGTTNAVVAIVIACIAILAIGLPISRYATRHGVDIDLLTRGASFGYIGSTVTSLIYASFTFILFAIEASIMSGALELAFHVPLWLGYVVSAVAVIPLVTHGVRLISRFQLITQPFWIVLNVLPLVFIAFVDRGKFDVWRAFAGLGQAQAALGTWAAFDLAKFGAASAVILALMTQIGEQVDFLRFLPADAAARKGHRFAIFLAGAGWVILGAPKLLAGSFLAVVALASGVPAESASQPGQMYAVGFGYMLPWPTVALVLMAIFVVVSQLKINVMNAYAGSLAWSNFFSRLTHSHPGRVIWLLFNVAIALLLMELGIYRVLEETLSIFSIIAMAWLCTIAADLFINKPLGLAPPGIEFKRAHLYDINPVGLGSMTLSAAIALTAQAGAFGPQVASLAPFIALGVALVASPTIAWATKGKFYLARKPRKAWANEKTLTCSICQHPFEPEDMAWCPAYSAPICSLCCSLDARCHDLCKPHAHIRAQTAAVAARILPEWAIEKLSTRIGRYGITVTAALTVLAGALFVIYQFAQRASPHAADVVGGTIAVVFFVFSVATGIACWYLVLAHDSRRVAEEESSRQNTLLLKEIDAHNRTDAALQRAKETAEAANRAKSRYVVGLSHELRTPLNAVLGYAQILERDETIPARRQSSIKTIRRSAEHLSGLIDGLLDISRIEAGRMQIYSNEINVHDFLDQLVEMFRLQAEAKGVAFNYIRAPHLPVHVRTDEKRLRQILVNLLSNAIKYTDHGAIDFSVDYRSQVASFTVRDTGTGIAADEIEHIFEPFVRGQAERNKMSPGLGLGLTITKLLSETLGGDIEVTSEPGQGASFRVRLMLARVHRPMARPAQDKALAGYAGSRRTIMVVDDNADHRELMRELLHPLDFVVLTAKDGHECLSLVEGIAPDLYFVDISMPGMNGWELVKRLRGQGRTAPIIMLSANIGDGTAEANADSGYTDTITKPFDVRQVLDKLGTHLHLRWIEAEAKPASAGAAPPVLRPSEAQLTELRNLGEIGHVRGIEAKLSELATTPDHGPFVDLLRARVQAFDFDGYARLLGDPHG